MKSSIVDDMVNKSSIIENLVTREPNCGEYGQGSSITEHMVNREPNCGIYGKYGYHKCGKMINKEINCRKYDQ